jgi:Ca-activated chloride channel family protein
MIFAVDPRKPAIQWGQKLLEVKAAAVQFVQRQNLKRDAVAVVGFGSAVHPLARLSNDGPQITLAIQSLADGGSTAMHAGLSAAASELNIMPESLRKQSPSRSILLFTDGQPDDQSAALEVARTCRAQNIRIVAIGTGDANKDYLAQLTGDAALVFRSDAGSYAEGFKQAEEAIRGRSLLEPQATRGGFLAELLRTSGWTALIAIGGSLALILGQNVYLRRPPLSGREGLLGVCGGLAAGIVGGAAGQLLFAAGSGIFQVRLIGTILAWICRIVGWAVLGALVGLGLSFFVPNLGRRQACAAGGTGGGAGALAFLMASLLGDTIGRFLGAAILGAFLGMMIALVEAVFRTLWLEVRYGQKEVVSVSLGATPVRIGGDNRVCTIYARGARPIAAEYKVVEGRVVCVDYATEKTSIVDPGDQRTIGHVTVTVRQSAKPGGGLEAAADVASAAAAGPLPPAAPPPRTPRSPAAAAPSAPAAPQSAAPAAAVPRSAAPAAPPPHKRGSPSSGSASAGPATPAAPRPADPPQGRPPAPSTGAGPLPPPPPPRRKTE